MAAHNELGKWGEDLAVAYLQGKDYMIIERDWKSGRRDIDIIAKDESGTIVFVEVKTRRNRVFGEPEEAIDYRKMQSLQQAINHYIKYHRTLRYHLYHWHDRLRTGNKPHQGCCTVIVNSE